MLGREGKMKDGDPTGYKLLRAGFGAAGVFFLCLGVAYSGTPAAEAGAADELGCFGTILSAILAAVGAMAFGGVFKATTRVREQDVPPPM